ncbi:MAG: protease inhibitor I42 family protein [Pseudomonadota bacterium]
MRTNIPAVFFATTLFGVSACHTAQQIEDQPDEPVVQSIVDPNTGTSFELELGGAIELVLKSNPTTGYYWYITGTQGTSIELLNEAYFADPAPEGLTGSGGRQKFTFGATAPGETTLQLSYQRHPEDVFESLNLDFHVGR